MDPELKAKLTKLFFNIEPPSLEDLENPVGPEAENPEAPEPAIIWGNETEEDPAQDGAIIENLGFIPDNFSDCSDIFSEMESENY